MSTPKEWYDVASKYYLIMPALFFPPYFFIDAPFGRFSPSKSSRLLFDGINSWIVMEIVSPICFLAALLSSPLTRPFSSLKRFPVSPPPLLTSVSFANISIPMLNAPAVLILMFLGHYLNRALLSPLRTPMRSKCHISVPLSGILFNTINGTLMGAFIAALATPKGQSGFKLFWHRQNTITPGWTFWVGVAMWALGFASNIWHDEVLLNLRRKQKSTASQDKSGENAKPHYAIPRGGLYTLISYPNYFSEWFEWLGYAVAASALTCSLPETHVVFPFAVGSLGLGALSTFPFVQQLTPPWIFLLSEVFLMFPRAWNGHKWYQKTFPDYPSERKAVLPFLL